MTCAHTNARGEVIICGRFDVEARHDEHAGVVINVE